MSDYVGPVVGRRLSALMLSVLCAAVSIVAGSDAAAETILTLRLQGPQGEPVAVTRAQLLVTAWGVSEQYDLPVDGNVLRFDLEATRAEFAGRDSDTSGHIYIKAAGYAPLISQSFAWPVKNRLTVIDFRDGRTATITPGNGASLELTLRRPLPRRIRLVDQTGRAVAGVNLEIATGWETPNHCGFLNGKDVLSAGITNTAGILDVPDVDGSYAFTLLDDRMRFADAAANVPATPRYGLVTSLTRTETTLVIRRYARRELDIDVLEKGKPLAGAVLWADMGLGVCGAGYGPLSTSDARGHIRVESFYPETWTNFWLCAGGKQAWVLPDHGKLPSKIDLGVSPSAESNGFADLCAK